MKYTVQKIIMDNAVVYNFLYENELLGHLIDTEDSRVLVSAGDTSIIPIVESFNFSGNCWVLDEGEYKLYILNPSPELEPLYEFKVVNLEDNLLVESEISE
jgi:hypothetical protein